MNKKILVFVATSALLVSSIGVAAGCAKKSVAVTETTPSVAIQVPEVSPVVHEEEADPTIITPVRFHNPVTDFIGDYYNSKTAFIVEASGDENAKVTVVLVNNNKTKTTLTVDAKFDPDTKTIEYTNGTKKTITLDKDGNAVSEKEIYNNGTGKFVFGTSEAIWNDSNEKIVNMVFKFGEPEQISQQVQTTKIKTPAKKKTAKKAAKKTVSKSTNTPTTAPGKVAKPKYSYGYTRYTSKGIEISVMLKKDNTATIYINVSHVDGDNIRTELYWQASGKLDPKTSIISYGNCKKQLLIHTNSGTMVRDQYSGGSGEIRFKGGHSLVWVDGKEHYADGTKFKMV